MIALALVGAGRGAWWLGRTHAGSGRTVAFVWPEGTSEKDGAALLERAGVVDGPSAFRLLLGVAHVFVSPEPGAHLLADDLTPFELLRRLARLPSRAHARVVVPEGYNRFQISARLEQARVCSRADFDRLVTDATWLANAGIAGDSAEGYLAPATYDLLCDTAPPNVANELVETTRKRLATVREAHAEAFAALSARYGWGDREVLTLASVVEKEAARADEAKVIASVFFNRLDDPAFRPARTLQSDPTAAYGCLVEPALESCRGYAGHVTPAMLRDPANAYNTYRHSGIPPGPIANPGPSAIASVLSPATTDYLFFVAAGDGRHVFSRTLEEHEAAIRRPR
ncbi:MAG TPA: endolytic transglycosylase MltG [Polyangiaceae bacterium]|nr:endolytic transglycosylase MltG [Polyangiaceae bacterium]